jgi:hypothetical protein
MSRRFLLCRLVKVGLVALLVLRAATESSHAASTPHPRAQCAVCLSGFAVEAASTYVELEPGESEWNRDSKNNQSPAESRRGVRKNPRGPPHLGERSRSS